MRLLGLFLIGCAMLSASHVRAVERLDIAKSSVAAVRAYHGNSALVQGSAVRIAPDRLVTNCHVTLGAQRIEVIENGGRSPAQLEIGSFARDICILRAAGRERPIPRRDATLITGHKVYAVGFPADHELTVTEGRVVALHDYDGGQVIQVSAPFDYGSSGGGLFDEEGHLVGILAFKARAGGLFHFALPVVWLDQSAGGDQRKDPPAARAFWQAQGRDLPYFLRAVSLEATGNWKALASLATDWMRREPVNAGAWRALRQAHLHIESSRAAPPLPGTAAALTLR